MSSWTGQKSNTGGNVNKAAFRNYYEILAVPPDATDKEISDAYAQARSMYSKDSVAFYSLYSGEEREGMLNELREAYNAISDPIKRRAYNAVLATHKQNKKEDDNILHIHTGEDLISETEAERCASLKKTPVAGGDWDPVSAEQYRILYTKMEHISNTRSCKSFAVTSALKGEGKSTTSFNLAYIVANEFKKKVLLIDCDLRKPAVSSYLNGCGSSGLVNVVKGEANFDDAVVRVKGSSLYVLHAGSHTRNPSEILSNAKLRRMLAELKEEYDYLIMDSPPILSMADMNIISKLADGIMLVVKSGNTPKDIVMKAARSLSGANIVGFILNGAETTKSNRYKYY